MYQWVPLPPPLLGLSGLKGLAPNGVAVGCGVAVGAIGLQEIQSPGSGFCRVPVGFFTKNRTICRRWNLSPVAPPVLYVLSKIGK